MTASGYLLSGTRYFPTFIWLMAELEYCRAIFIKEDDSEEEYRGKRSYIMTYLYRPTSKLVVPSLPLQVGVSMS